jgi:tRNA A-37 threonylcarbamoyl transferase component Bud32/dienelactone hydrolase
MSEPKGSHQSGEMSARPDYLRLEDDIEVGSLRSPIGMTIANRYRINEKIAAGGMATVFLADDQKHGRQVAVKVLHETLTHTIGIQRFLREIEVIARLQHPHLLTLIDSGDVDQLPYYVMPYIEAQSLRELIADKKRLPCDEAVRITREVADGLDYAHRNGVIHRDIKPSNILMSGGHAVVADFGIATALQRAAVGRLTETGISLGSPTYMSPEQAAGERDVDERSDIYSLACVLYEMISGEPPIDGSSMQQMVTRKLTGGFTPLREMRTDVPPALAAAIHRALAPDRNARFGSIAEFSAAIAAALPVARRSRAVWHTAAVAAVAVAALATWLRHEVRVVRATQRVAEVSRLSMSGNLLGAFRLSQEILPVIPADTTLQRLRGFFTDFLTIVTEPAGARVSFQPLDSAESPWRVIGVTPIDSLAFPRLLGSGTDYRVRIERAGYEPRELLVNSFANLAPSANWQAPAGIFLPLDTVRLARVGAMPGMLSIRRGRYADIDVADFYAGKTEVTNREYARFVAAGGYEKPEYWTEPMMREGRPIAWADAMRLFRDESGAAGPSTWTGGHYPAGQDDFPVGGVSYYEAAAYARFAGKRLPTLGHWRLAAMRNMREFGWTFARASNMNSVQPRPVGKGTINNLGLYDVAGNVREWCSTPGTANTGRVAMGGGWEDPEYMMNNLVIRPDFDRTPSIGLSLFEFADEDSIIARLSRPVSRSVRRDFRGFRAVSDAQFALYRSLFTYDQRALDARIDSTGVSDNFRWEKVSFTAAYGDERMIAYVVLPRTGAGPFEPVVFWQPGAPISVKTGVPEGLVASDLYGFLAQKGRAVVVPLFKESYERDGANARRIAGAPDSSVRSRDHVIQWIKDMRRSIDYIETRNDLRADRIGFFGVSWGGLMAPMALALEPRIKAGVISGGGYVPAQYPLPEVEMANYTPRVHQPVLMLSGQHDNSLYPYETSQLPFFDQLGTPLVLKKRVEYSTAGHIVPLDVIVRETLEWFDHHLRR